MAITPHGLMGEIHFTSLKIMKINAPHHELWWDLASMLPELFDIFFSNVATIHDHDTRSARLNYIYTQFKGTTRGQKAFSYSGAYIWNFILSHIETDCAIGTLKNLRTALLLNSKEDLPNWISTNMDIFHVSVPKCICVSVLVLYEWILIFLTSWNLQ